MEENKKICCSVINSKKIEIPDGVDGFNSRSFVSWGADNQYPNFIKKIYRESATVRSIIDGTVNYVLGNDIVLGEGMERFTEQVNKKGETMYDLLGQIATDYLIFKGFALEIIYSKLGTVAEMYALDITKCRVNERGDKVYFNRKGWGQYTSKYDEYDAFDRSKWKADRPQIFFYKGFSKTVYPESSWQGAFRDAMAEIESSKYTLNSMSNGLAAKHMVTIPDEGNLTDEDKDYVEAAIKDKFTGPEAESSFFIFWQTGEKQLKVDAIQTQDESQKFESIRKAARENIFIGFQATPNLFGLPTETTGFNSQEFESAYKLYEKARIQPTQKALIKVFDKIMGVKDSFRIEPYVIDFGNAE